MAQKVKKKESKADSVPMIFLFGSIDHHFLGLSLPILFFHGHSMGGDLKFEFFGFLCGKIWIFSPKFLILGKYILNPL